MTTTSIMLALEQTEEPPVIPQLSSKLPAGKDQSPPSVEMVDEMQSTPEVVAEDGEPFPLSDAAQVVVIPLPPTENKGDVIMFLDPPPPR